MRGVVPENALSDKTVQSYGTWIILSVLGVSWAIADGLFLHDYLIASAWDFNLITLFEAALSAGVSICAYEFIMPELNKIFVPEQPFIREDEPKPYMSPSVAAT